MTIRCMVGRVRMLLLGVAAVLLLAAPASASRMPAPPHVVVHEDTPCPAYAGGRSCSSSDSDDVYLAPGTSRDVRLHELGHQFDRQVLTDGNRAWFTRVLGYEPNARWLGGWTDYGEGVVEPWEHHKALPGEAFAETYANCALNRPPLRTKIRQGGRRAGMRVYDVRQGDGLLSYKLSIRRYQQVCNGIVVLALVR